MTNFRFAKKVTGNSLLLVKRSIHVQIHSAVTLERTSLRSHTLEMTTGYNVNFSKIPYLYIVVTIYLLEPLLFALFAPERVDSFLLERLNRKASIT